MVFPWSNTSPLSGRKWGLFHELTLTMQDWLSTKCLRFTLEKHFIFSLLSPYLFLFPFPAFFSFCVQHTYLCLFLYKKEDSFLRGKQNNYVYFISFLLISFNFLVLNDTEEKINLEFILKKNTVSRKKNSDSPSKFNHPSHLDILDHFIFCIHSLISMGIAHTHYKESNNTGCTKANTKNSPQNNHWEIILITIRWLSF